jgi:hypothetical protein
MRKKVDRMSWKELVLDLVVELRKNLMGLVLDHHPESPERVLRILEKVQGRRHRLGSCNE